MRDMISNVQVIRGAVQTLSGVTPNNSALIDRRGFDALTVYLETGTVTDAGTADGFTMKLQHSDTTDASDFVDVPTAGLLANSDGGTTVAVTVDATNGVIAGGVGYVGGKRYVRAVVTGTTGTNATVQALAALGKPHRAPVATVGATTAAT
ncbi:hypothetical protein [Yoonia sp.]|uniref:hypothetical protein n=1 Tax=Yoonia sp. TaxID=2212373 RepID=UPI002DFA8195|nr:hypothetical protein [Yoonia sp.]